MKSLFINVYRTAHGTEFVDGSGSHRGADANAELEERRTPGVRRVACKEITFEEGEGLEENQQ